MLSKSKLLMGVSAVLISMGFFSASADFNPEKGDFTGDSKKELTVYNKSTFRWFSMEAVSNNVPMYNEPWGFSSTVPLVGNFDNTNGTDIAAYDQITGKWYIRTVGGPQSYTVDWGFRDTVPLVGQYDGTEGDDMAVFDTNTGNWYIRTLGTNNPIIAYGTNWGYKGVTPLVGDFNLDGIDDLVVYDSNSYKWYIRTLAGAVIEFGKPWGFNGAIPLVLDYDNDGYDDIAVFDPDTGNWYIHSVQNDETLAWNLNWGFQGGIPSVGDFGGDEGDDLAVYNGSTGHWFIRSSDTNAPIIAYNKQWGDSNMRPYDTVNVALHRPVLTGGDGFLFKPSTTLVLLGNQYKGKVAKMTFAFDPAGQSEFNQSRFTGYFGGRLKFRHETAREFIRGKSFYVVVHFKDGSLPQPYYIYNGSHRQS